MRATDKDVFKIIYFDMNFVQDYVNAFIGGSRSEKDLLGLTVKLIADLIKKLEYKGG